MTVYTDLHVHTEIRINHMDPKSTAHTFSSTSACAASPICVCVRACAHAFPERHKSPCVLKYPQRLSWQSDLSEFYDFIRNWTWWKSMNISRVQMTADSCPMRVLSVWCESWHSLLWKPLRAQHGCVAHTTVRVQKSFVIGSVGRAYSNFRPRLPRSGTSGIHQP